MRTAINEDSHEDSIANTYLPASVQVSRHNDHDKRHKESYQNLQHVLSQETLALGSMMDHDKNTEPTAEPEVEDAKFKTYKES